MHHAVVQQRAKRHREAGWLTRAPKRSFESTAHLHGRWRLCCNARRACSHHSAWRNACSCRSRSLPVCHTRRTRGRSVLRSPTRCRTADPHAWPHPYRRAANRCNRLSCCRALTCVASRVLYASLSLCHRHSRSDRRPGRHATTPAVALPLPPSRRGSPMTRCLPRCRDTTPAVTRTACHRATTAGGRAASPTVALPFPLLRRHHRRDPTRSPPPCRYRLARCHLRCRGSTPDVTRHARCRATGAG